MLWRIYVAIFIFTLHFALLLYSASTYLTKFIPKQGLEALYIAGSITAITLLSLAPRIMRAYGQRKATLGFTGLLLLAALGMGFSGATIGILISFVALFALQNVLRFDFDVYIERYSKNKNAGKDRGITLTIMNLGVALAPFLAGKIIDNYGFPSLYLTAALLLVPVALIAYSVNHVRDLKYHKAPFFRTLRALRQRRDLWHAFSSNFLLEFFYVWMVIYAPLYLTQTIGFSWETVGIVLSIMLLPFVIFEYPAGYLADKYYGEKEMLVAGFVIMGTSTLLLPFISSTNPAVWAAMLFITRIGAAFMEIMTEAYYFKKVGPENTDFISFFRDSRPLAYLFGTLSAAIILPIINYNYAMLFFILGTLILLGTRHAIALKDTK